MTQEFGQVFGKNNYGTSLRNAWPVLLPLGGQKVFDQKVKL